ncbi:hypothetical protein H4582DRAFT_1818665 [Lactarius indigo]|nr:hypothetical protein H4582DRAFT_1818665 [Lactarius indigo]
MNKRPKPFCPFILHIAVVLKSLIYEDIITAADVVRKILTNANLKIEVAFVELVVIQSASPKLLLFDPLVDLSELLTAIHCLLVLHFNSNYPHYKGTGGLYLCLFQNNNHIVVLTYAHTTCSPPIYKNIGITCTKTSQPHEKIIVLMCLIQWPTTMLSTPCWPLSAATFNQSTPGMLQLRG